MKIRGKSIDEVIKKGKVRRAKLNFLKTRVGGYRIKERGNKA